MAVSRRAWSAPSLALASVAFATAFATACHKTGSGADDGAGGANGSSGASGSTHADEPKTCSPAGVDPSKRAPTWTVPANCKVQPLNPATRVLVRKESELAAANVKCEGPSGIDFTKNALLVAANTLSPATVGVDAFDDGAKVTLSSRFQYPCKDESRYPPMPVTLPLTYVVAAGGGDRTFVDANCSLPCR